MSKTKRKAEPSPELMRTLKVLMEPKPMPAKPAATTPSTYLRGPGSMDVTDAEWLAGLKAGDEVAMQKGGAAPGYFAFHRVGYVGVETFGLMGYEFSRRTGESVEPVGGVTRRVVAPTPERRESTLRCRLREVIVSAVVAEGLRVPTDRIEAALALLRPETGEGGET